MKKKYITIFTILTFLVPLTMLAQKVGTTSMQFLKVMPTARATAMGDAAVATIDGIDAVFWNPAGLTTIESPQLSSTYTLWIFDTKQSAVSVGMNVEGIGVFAAQFQMTDIGTIEETRLESQGFDAAGNFNPGFTGNTFSPQSLLLGISYAAQLTDHFAIGLSTKYAMESLWSSGTAAAPAAPGVVKEYYNTNAKVLLFDFGMKYNTGYKSLQIGAVVQNFGAQAKYAVEEYPVPLEFRIGISGNLIGPNALLSDNSENRVILAYDILQPNDYDQQMHIGLEYMFHDLLALRTGYKYNYDNEGLTFGGGVQTDLSGARILVDYSFGSMGTYLGNVHRISLGVQFK